MNNTSRDLSKLIFYPAQAAEAGVEFIHYLYRLKYENGIIGVPTCLPTLDDKVLPAIAGQYCVVEAVSGHGKTSFLNFMARTWGTVIQNSTRSDKGFVVVATTESLVEQLTIFHAANALKFRVSDMRRGKLADETLTDIERWMMTDRAGFPLVIIGASFKYRGQTDPLSVETVSAAVRQVEAETGKKCELVCLDYLQALAAPKSISIRNQDNLVQVVRANSLAVKTGAGATGCPWWVGVQARTEVEDRPSPIPNQRDPQWASQIFQDCDTMLSVCRPGKYRREKDAFAKDLLQKYAVDINNAQDERARRLLLVKVLKQREEDVGDIVPIYMDAAYNVLDDWDRARHDENSPYQN